jgi:hypothetical protein
MARSIVLTMGAALGTNTRFGSIRISDDVESGTTAGAEIETRRPVASVDSDTHNEFRLAAVSLSGG